MSMIDIKDDPDEFVLGQLFLNKYNLLINYDHSPNHGYFIDMYLSTSRAHITTPVKVVNFVSCVVFISLLVLVFYKLYRKRIEREEEYERLIG